MHCDCMRTIIGSHCALGHLPHSAAPGRVACKLFTQSQRACTCSTARRQAASRPRSSSRMRAERAAASAAAASLRARALRGAPMHMTFGSGSHSQRPPATAACLRARALPAFLPCDSWLKAEQGASAAHSMQSCEQMQLTMHACLTCEQHILVMISGASICSGSLSSYMVAAPAVARARGRVRGAPRRLRGHAGGA